MTEAESTTVQRWRATAIGSAVVFLGLVVLFWSTVASMVHTWYHFETYTHGFLILPISLWLIWQKRQHIAAFTPQPAPGFLVFALGALLVWAMAKLIGVLVVEQLAFVGLLVIGLASVLGWQVAKFLMFPLLFLFFAVPMGEDLVQPMMEFTATFTVEALKLTGIPVYRDGLWFSLPSGDWSVVEACSGVRYLIASITLGFMYAYITYHTLWKRLLFIALSAVVPILANGVRAYMIVMIGHLSEMEYATGVDHLIYGWVFFGLVMFILFWLGSFWQEDQDPPAFVPPRRQMNNASVGNHVAMVSVVLLLVSSGVVWGTWKAAHVEVALAKPLAPPAGVDGWALQDQPVSWASSHQPTDQTISARYANGDQVVQLYVVLFPQQRQGNEAINQENDIAEHVLRRTERRRQSVDLGGVPVVVNQAKTIVDYQDEHFDHMVWQWYRVAGRSLTNRYEGKAWEAVARIYPGRSDGAWIAITTPLESQDVATAQKTLASFARDMTPEVNRAIDETLGQGD